MHKIVSYGYTARVQPGRGAHHYTICTCELDESPGAPTVISLGEAVGCPFELVIKPFVAVTRHAQQVIRVGARLERSAQAAAFVLQEGKQQPGIDGKFPRYAADDLGRAVPARAAQVLAMPCKVAACLLDVMRHIEVCCRGRVDYLTIR